MTDDQLPIDPLMAERASERRQFFRTALGAAAVTVAGAAALTVGPRAFADTSNDVDFLNFALQLKYLEAQFYNFAAFGTGLSAGQITAGSTTLTGTNVAGAATGARQVSFTDPVVAQIAGEIAQDSAAHVAWLRTELGTQTSAQPAIDLSTTATGAFSTAMRAATVISGASATFDPYASDGNFLLAAFLLADIGVTALRNASPLLADTGHVEVLNGAMITDAYHSAAIRTLLYAKGATTASLRSNADLISNLRDALDGTTDDDQGISPTTGTNPVSNVVPTYADGTVYARGAGNVLNILFLNSAQVTKGGFFPSGVNGTVTTSTAN
ncbi:ferritin-like domain-containing protein [Sphingomonas sp. RT2P30]|uniref:ferritin-like domain-containing protein n=1 Tax=Parasphingomonas halimpatiens TaxID=3096162 RepID=UPI002FC75921